MDEFMSLLGIEDEDLRYIVSEDGQGRCTTVSYDEAHGIIEGEYTVINDTQPGQPYSNTLPGG